MPLPPLTEQRAIAHMLKAIEDRKTALEQETNRLNELFHAMLEELMTGKRSAVPLIDDGIVKLTEEAPEWLHQRFNIRLKF